MAKQVSNSFSPVQKSVSLDDKYTARDGTILLNGSQVLVRLMIEQSRADQQVGLNTAGFISGYRGSPLGSVDQAFWTSAGHLKPLNIRFEPGLNEDLAATSVWGTQQTELLGGGPYDGVFGLWYGKSPGVDRSGDVFRHGNINGTSPHGGMLAVSGDDPGASSSTIPNQCEHGFAALMMPVLYPADIADILNFGRFGFEMSRYSGLWVAMKTVADTVESTATVDLDLLTKQFKTPDNPVTRDQVTARWPDDRWSQDKRLQEIKLPAALDFAATNRIDRVVLGSCNQKRRIGIITAGKASLDVVEALSRLGIDEAVANEIGLSVCKIGMIWPLEPLGLTTFADGLEALFVIEERRAFLETQIKEITFHWEANRRPDIHGKNDSSGAPLFSSLGETSPTGVAEILGPQLIRISDHQAIKSGLKRVQALNNVFSEDGAMPPPPIRIPHFCAGCPHSRSTDLPENSVAMAGIGCHSLAMWMEGRNTRLLTHMGGEGANWIGAAAFVDMPHVFQNMGDGTYTHSGLLAIRAAIAAKTTITYKILFNDAVAMTGGQPAEGAPSVGDVARQLLAERVKKLVVISDQPDTLKRANLPAGVEPVHRDRLGEMMETCRATKGVSAIIYDQICATEKRRRIRAGTLPEPETRVFINQRVCEGCGDCSVKSGCVAIESVDTPFGLKRWINQSVCNLDMSCIDGFCPAIVTVKGRSRKPALQVQEWGAPLPDPVLHQNAGTKNILIAGVGGTGLITIGAILGMAAHLEGKYCSILDNTGLARKGGGVTTHLRIGDKKQQYAARIDVGGCDLLLAGDPIFAASTEVLKRLSTGYSQAIVNSHIIPTAMQAQDPNSVIDADVLLARVSKATGGQNCLTIDASGLARNLIGDDIFANVILLGAAFQDGQIPLQATSLTQAIELNGIAVQSNLQAYELGRRFIADPDSVPVDAGAGDKAPDFEEVLNILFEDLNRSHSKRVASDFQELVDEISAAEEAIEREVGSVSWAVAQNLHRLLASKDEFEVARLMIDDQFKRTVEHEFDGAKTISYHFASPILGFRAKNNTKGFKKSFGPWLRKVLILLANLKCIRGGFADPFRFHSERKLERHLLSLFSGDISQIRALLAVGDTDNALALARWPEGIRGFGPIKQKRAEEALQSRQTLFKTLTNELEAANG